MAKQYIQLYYDYLDAVEELTDVERGRLFVALLKYGMSGTAEKLNGNERYLYSMMKKQIDRDNKAYDDKCDANRENGKLGGRPKKMNDNDGLRPYQLWSEAPCLNDGAKLCDNNGDSLRAFYENQTVLEKPKKKEKKKENDKEKDNTADESFARIRGEEKPLSMMAEGHTLATARNASVSSLARNASVSSLANERELIQYFLDNVQATPGKYVLDKLCGWLDVFAADVVIKAIDEAVRANKRSLSYVEGVLRNWQEKKLFTLSLVEGHLLEWAKTKAEGRTLTNAEGRTLKHSQINVFEGSGKKEGALLRAKDGASLRAKDGALLRANGIVAKNKFCNYQSRDWDYDSLLKLEQEHIENSVKRGEV